MAFKTWQTGIHIQQDRVLIVALTKEKSGWRLRRWWAVSWQTGLSATGKFSSQNIWLPRYATGGGRCPITTGYSSHFPLRARYNARCRARPWPFVTASRFLGGFHAVPGAGDVHRRAVL